MPFTDNVNLSDADRRAFTAYAQMQKIKEYEHIHVTFDHGGQARLAKLQAAVEAERSIADESAVADDQSITRRLRAVEGPRPRDENGEVG